MSSRLFAFAGGDFGAWRVTEMRHIVGDPLPTVSHLHVCSVDALSATSNPHWVLRGITSNERYITAAEKSQLVAVQQGLGRRGTSCAALLPIRKSAAWWALSQDARRAIFEERSNHVKIGLKHLPPVARRLHHCRDLSESEPFDFLTWFEYAASYERQFDELVAELRASEEWEYVDREIDIRMVRTDT
jgi:chlorite dismutase